MYKVGVKSLSFKDLATSSSIKKDILLFDKLILDKHSIEDIRRGLFMMSLESREQYKNIISDVEFLETKGIIEIKNISDHEVMPESKSINREFLEIYKKELINSFKIINDISQKDKWDDLKISIENFQDVRIKLYCIQEYINNRFDSFPILNSSQSATYKYFDKKEEVLRFLLTKIPMPDPLTSLEKIIDFRNDPNTKRRYYAIIDWINEISKSPLSKNEIEDKFKYLYSEYEHQFKIHSLKYHHSTLEILTISTFEVLENVLTLKWSAAAKKIFDLKKQSLNLIDAETKISGREVAYIYHLNSEFG